MTLKNALTCFAHALFVIFVAVLLIYIPPEIHAAEIDAGIQDLLKAYPEHLIKSDGNYIYWQDGSKMPYDDGKVKKDFEELLNKPDIQDQMSMKYPFGEKIDYSPPENFDPGRIRYEPFFRKMYGNTKKEVIKNLVTIYWMPKTVNKPIFVTKVNRVDLKLQKISEELDKLPDEIKKYVKDIAAFMWRNIKGTQRLSMHSFGIAIDINPKHSNYWQWSRPDKTGKYLHENKIPFEIVKIFEENGFIWGGRSYSIETLQTLQKEMPNNEISFIAGTDSFNEITTWCEYERLFELTNFIVVTRHGYPVKKIGEVLPDKMARQFGYDPKKDAYVHKKGKIVTYLATTLMDISASDIRQRIKDERSIRYLMPQDVERYIVGKKLYV